MTRIYSKALFVVTEKHMLSNYTHLIEELKKRGVDVQIYLLPYFNTLSLKNNILKSPSHICNLKNLLEKDFGNHIEGKLIIYSNAEGPIINNRALWMPKLIGCKEVLLQHGFMDTRMQSGKVLLRKMINYLLKLTLGYNVEALGSKFGESKADLILVFGEKYKNYVVRRGWAENQILVSGSLLKPKINGEVRKNKSTCLLFLQDLKYYGFSYHKMICIYKSIIEELSSTYKNVIVRRHPKMAENIYSEFSSSTNNVSFSNSALKDDVLKCDKAFAIASTALVDAYLAGREIVAIRLPKMKDVTFETFNRVVNLSDFPSYLKKYKFADPCAKMKDDFFKVTEDVNVVMPIILES